MTLDNHERVDAGRSQPTSPAAPRDSGVEADKPHPSSSFYSGDELDPTARLEWLDDLMFAAIEGDPIALDHAAVAWRKVRSELGDSATEETRLQYMRHAQTVWHSLRGEPNHPPHKVFAAIEIISLLAGKAY